VFCKADWNYEFCQRNFSKAFVDGKLKDHNKHILLEREKNFLPETQKELEIIEHNKRIDELVNKRKEDINKINMLIERLKREKWFYNKNNNSNEEQKDLILLASILRKQFKIRALVTMKFYFLKST
jgi:hypothetical protein